METKPKMIKYLNNVNSGNSFQLEIEQNEEPNFNYSSVSKFSTKFGTFAYNDKHQSANFSGKLKYNSEKGCYEEFIETGRIEISPKTIWGFSDGPSTIWEGESFKKLIEEYEKGLIWFYNDTNSRFARTPEPTVILTSDNTSPLFCKFHSLGNNSDHKGMEFRLGNHWMSLAQEGYCLIF